MKTYHGAEIYAAFTEAGGTDELWKARVVPLMRAAGDGPLFVMSEETFNHIISLANKDNGAK